MLIWAVFTLGYLFGVFFALGVLLRKEEVEGVSYTTDSTSPHDFQSDNPWKTFQKLIKPNYPKKTVLTPTASIINNTEDSPSRALSPAS